MISNDIEEAIKELRSNNIIGLPTETVYGLAGNAYSEVAIEKIFALKQRPLYNPLIVHIKSAEYLSAVTVDIPQKAQLLADTFWPGPMTLVLRKKSRIPNIVTAGKDTVAVRVPSHKIALDLLRQIDFPLAAPSANPFGSISPTSALHVFNYFEDRLKVILDGGECQRGIESTIIGFDNDEPVIYRLGSLSLDLIENLLGPIKIKMHSAENAPEAPGMLSRHYAPSTETYLSDNIDELIEQHSNKRIGLLLFKNYKDGILREQQQILSQSGDTQEAAKNFYAAMHHLDSLNLDVIIAERLPDIGFGRTLNDKLKRASKKA
jgi:L-threonylcarbamoyladenylate synthase